MKTKILVLIAVMLLGGAILTPKAQVNPKSSQHKTPEESTKQRTEETTKEQKMYDEIFGDCNDYLRQAVSNVKNTNKDPNWSLGSSTAIQSLKGLLNIEVYKTCRELKHDK